MKLPKRLEAVASFVSNKGRIIDVGANHGLICLYFSLKGRNEEIIATDENPKSLVEAEKNFKTYHQENKIKIHIGDGLDGIELQDDDNIVISGMGTRTIRHILTPRVLKDCSHFIIQSNNDLYELRKFMTNHGFMIDDEVVVNERLFYVVIDFKRGEESYSEEELTYGPCLLKNPNSEYFTYLYQKIKEQYENIPNNSLLKESKKQELETLKKIKDYL